MTASLKCLCSLSLWAAVGRCAGSQARGRRGRREPPVEAIGDPLIRLAGVDARNADLEVERWREHPREIEASVRTGTEQHPRDTPLDDVERNAGAAPLVPE